MGGVNIPLPELDITKPAQNAPPDALAEFQRASQLQTAAAQQQAILAQTQGQQQQNQVQALQLKDEQLRRSLAPQFVQKDANGKPNGFDNEGLYNAMLQGGADPMSINAMRMKQVEMQKSLIGLGDAQIEHQKKINGEFFNSLESVRDIQKKTAPEQAAASAPTPNPTAASSMGPAVPGTGGMPAGMLPNMPQAQDLGKAPPGSPESLGHVQDGSAPTSTESALQTSQANAPRPITPQAQMAYQKELIRLSSMGIPVGKLKPMLTDESDLDQSEAELGLHAQSLAEAKELAGTQEQAGKGAQAQAEAKKAEWIGSDGTFANIRTGQVIHAGGSPSLQAFQQYVSRGGDPLNFASDQAAREASNPVLQSAKLHLATMEKSAEQAIADGDPKAAAQLLVSGDVAPSQLISSRKPAFAQAALTKAKKMSPGWNAKKADADFKVASSPAQVQFFGSAKSLTDAGGTLDQLEAAAKDIPDGKIPVFNNLADLYRASTGSGPIAKYASILVGVADDYSKVMGGGQGSDASRTQALGLAPAKASPEARHAAVEGIRGAVSSQITSRIGNNDVLKKMYGDSVPAQSAAPTVKTMQVGQSVSIKGKPMKVTAVHPDGSFDAQ